MRWAFLAALAAPLVLVSLTSSSGCEGDNGLDIRRGLTGDSCTRTDDCTAPLRCLENICTAPPSDVDAGYPPDAFPPGPGPSADAGPWSQCDECLDTACGAADKACGPDCRAIEACIESTCLHLSETGSSDEGACFTNCQNRFSAGKEQHLAVVNCAQTHTCSPPCTFYPQDYELCRTFMDNGDCNGYKKACDTSTECTTYRDCRSLCGTLADCLGCDDTPEGAKGKKLLELYEVCIANECMVESWIP